MKEILIIRCDDKEFRISIEGSNIDLLSGMAHVIKTMEKESDVPIEVALNYLTRYLKEEED